MCFGSPRDKDAEGCAAKNKEIDKLLRADEKKQQREVKLLLLGKLVLSIIIRDQLLCEVLAYSFWLRWNIVLYTADHAYS